MAEHVQKECRDPSTIPEDIYALLDDDNDHEVTEANVEWAGELFKDILRSRLKKREEKRGEEVLRFSSLGKRDRQIWYAANKPEAAEKMPGKQNFKFLYGDTIEILLLFLAKEAGHEVTDCQLGVECDGVKGSIDAVIDGVLTDVKSASSFSFEKFKSGNFKFDDPFGYLAQLGGYANATGHNRAGFLVADKVHGDICFAELDNYDIEGNTPKPRIDHLRSVIASESPPTRCYPDTPEGKSGNRKLALGCSYCPFKEDCWSDANGGKGLRKFVYSRGPVWLTEVKREPKVGES
jgi:hypothetical protein